MDFATSFTSTRIIEAITAPDKRERTPPRMHITFTSGSNRWRIDLSRPTTLAIPQTFDRDQVNHFGVSKAWREPIRAGSFVGDTRAGGSCNVERISVIPHCNGTHTEHVGHIVDEVPGHPLSAVPPHLVARLVSLPTVAGGEALETYRPPLAAADRVITGTSLQEAWDRGPSIDLAARALILRTVPNDPRKTTWQYGSDVEPPFLTIEAVDWIVRRGIEHLLVDFPSLDRTRDEGLLTNHHRFWKVPEGTHRLSNDSRLGCTITELIFVPDGVPDGWYGLNLQFPDWATDAVPSRPVLFPIEADDSRD
jgi:kynurenine formamidase